MFMKKSMLFVLIAFVMIAAIPACAVKWIDEGSSKGMHTGIYLDLDSISDKGTNITLVYKYMNESILKAMSYAYTGGKKSLSVCLIQGNMDCATKKWASLAILCYDKSGNVVVDIPNVNVTESAFNLPPGSCQDMRKYLKDLTK